MFLQKSIGGMWWLGVTSLPNLSVTPGLAALPYARYLRLCKIKKISPMGESGKLVFFCIN